MQLHIVSHFDISEVKVCSADNEACNGVYHGDISASDVSPRMVYHNNNGGVIYFSDGQWRLTTRELSADGCTVIGMCYAGDALYTIESIALVPPSGQWKMHTGDGCCSVEVDVMSFCFTMSVCRLLIGCSCQYMLRVILVHVMFVLRFARLNHNMVSNHLPMTLVALGYMGLRTK